MNVEQVKSLVKAIHCPGRAAIGNAVSETSEHHFIVACHICKYWCCTSRESKTCSDLVTTGGLFEEAERQMELERNLYNNKEIFHAFTDAYLNKNFNVLYEDFEYRCSSVCGCTKNPISCLMKNNLIPKDEADDPEAEYVTLDQQVIQRATIVKAVNLNDVNIENSGGRSKEADANTDNAKLFDLAKTAFGETRLWVHVKPSQRNRDRRQALKLIWFNQLVVHALDKCNTKNHKDIRVIDYHGEKKIHNRQAYVLDHKICHDVQTALVGQELNDFTDCNKVTFLLDGINCDILDFVISVVSG